jgi:hypothetical protein
MNRKAPKPANRERLWSEGSWCPAIASNITPTMVDPAPLTRIAHCHPTREWRPTATANWVSPDTNAQPPKALSTADVSFVLVTAVATTATMLRASFTTCRRESAASGWVRGSGTEAATLMTGQMIRRVIVTARCVLHEGGAYSVYLPSMYVHEEGKGARPCRFVTASSGC